MIFAYRILLLLLLVTLTTSALVSEELVSEQAKLLASTIAELEKCRETSEHKCKPVVLNDDGDRWEALVLLRWKLEVAQRDLELELNRPVVEIATRRFTEWFNEKVKLLAVLRKDAEIYLEKHFLRFSAIEVQEYLSKQMQAVSTSVWRSTLVLVSDATTMKIHAEKEFLLFLKANLPKELMPYADQIVAFAFIGFPAFILAVIWHAVTNKIQRCCARLLFRGRAAELLNEETTTRQAPQPQEQPVRLGREHVTTTRTEQTTERLIRPLSRGERE